ncbi:hypothetical protein CASFOL_036316 [Castilleja foliolosa]|uniref:Uncharacterized protein n=1 Tax=Castilleja foliolosa TaxID=1961234 RepID=A0ABD3BV73_9LAMI
MNLNPISILNSSPNLNQLMDKPSINPPNLIDLQFIKPHQIPLSDGALIDFHADDIEMLAFQSISYTTLKDLIPSSPSSNVSPTSGSSWREIPIKDPLVQHAAWAYLQPMAEARGEDRRWWKRVWGCFNDVVLVMFKGFFPDQGRDGDDRVD